MYDFSNIQLSYIERCKLFVMRFKKYVTEDFLGVETFAMCMSYKFIAAQYKFSDTTPQRSRKPTLYHLTDKYYRYCIYRRQKFFDKAIWPILVSIIAAVITSIITSYIVSGMVSKDASTQAIEQLIERLL